MLALTRVYQALIYYGGLLKSPILLLCRLNWGILFLLAGWKKLQGIDTFASLLSEQGFPYEYFFAHLAAWTEFLGGICLLLGLASRLMAIPLIITMLTAYATVHFDAVKAIWYDPSQFVAQAPFTFLLAALLVLAFGPGRFSLDYAIEKMLFNKARGIPKHQHLNE
ncbi:MAG: DoxX family protein [Parachlamydia sp.]|jgi:putative oxidoreductase|nr:DoxX family protein [Parachlamydia sp.]